MVNEPLIAHGVATAVCMWAAIDLNHKPSLPTDKIDDIRTDSLLTYEFETTQ